MVSITPWTSLDLSCKSDNINASVAKDIDIIQALYQCCCYYLKSNINSNSEDLQNWFDELYDVSTLEGRRIVELLIINNPLFESLVKRFGKTMEEYYG